MGKEGGAVNGRSRHVNHSSSSSQLFLIPHHHPNSNLYSLSLSFHIENWDLSHTQKLFLGNQRLEGLLNCCHSALPNTRGVGDDDESHLFRHPLQWYCWKERDLANRGSCSDAPNSVLNHAISMEGITIWNMVDIRVCVGAGESGFRIFFCRKNSNLPSSGHTHTLMGIPFLCVWPFAGRVLLVVHHIPSSSWVFDYSWKVNDVCEWMACVCFSYWVCEFAKCLSKRKS